MEQHTLKNVNNCLNTQIYSYLKTSNGQSSNLYLIVVHFSLPVLIELRALKNVNNCLNTNIYSYLQTSGGQSSYIYLNVVHFFQHQS